MDPNAAVSADKGSLALRRGSVAVAFLFVFICTAAAIRHFNRIPSSVHAGGEKFTSAKRPPDPHDHAPPLSGSIEHARDSGKDRSNIPRNSGPPADDSVKQRKSWLQGYRPLDKLGQETPLSGWITSPTGPVSGSEVIIEWIYSWDARGVLPPFGVMTRIDPEGTRWLRRTIMTDENGFFSIDKAPKVLLRLQVGRVAQSIQPGERIRVVLDGNP